MSLAFSADGLTVASGSLDGTIRVWDASSIGGSRLGVEKNKQEEWNFLNWSPRGQAVMATQSGGGKVWIWSTQDGTSMVLEDCLYGFAVAISDCGRYLAEKSRNSDGTTTITTRRIASNVAQSNSFSLRASDSHRREFFPNSTRFAATSQKKILTWDASVAHPEVTSLVGHSTEVDDLRFILDGSGSLLLSRADEEVFAWNVDTLQLVSRTGNVIPRYHTPVIKATEDNWVVMIPPDHGGRRRLFRLPSEYQPHGFWSISESWLSKCILIRRRNGNVLIVDFSALSAATTDLPN